MSIIVNYATFYKKLILQEKKYLESFTCIRKWKINFNLLVDCDVLMNVKPDGDNDNGLLKPFVTQLIKNNKINDNQKVDYLNLFIVTLDNNDCTKINYYDVIMSNVINHHKSTTTSNNNDHNN